jgi:RHS repeat-associated protein
LQEVRAPGDASTAPNHLRESYVYSSTHGQLTQRTRTIGSASYTFDFLSDTHGRLSRITYPTNVDAQRLAVEYLYDGWSALSQVRNFNTPSLVYYTLNSQEGSGAVRRATLGNGVVEQYGYEATTGQLASIQTGLGGSAALQNLSYDWDLAGNLEQRVVRNASGTPVTTDVFGYDALDRLTSLQRNSSTIFSVTYNNLIGNITTKTGVSGTYTYGSSRPHAVTAIGSMTFAYDTNGNMTNRNGTTINWSSYNLPIHIQRPSGEYSDFLYGADRDRYRQIEGAGALQSIRHYASPGLFESLTWNSGASRVDYHYIYANGRAVAQFTASNVETDTLEYLHRDHQGSVVATTSDTGSLLDRFEYDPFGVRSTTVGNDAREHRGYTGHEHLKAQELIHMNGRVQDPVIGRFLSPDPIVQAPYDSRSLNRYSYVWNNPMTLVDPSGFGARERQRGPEPPRGECQDTVAGGYLCGDPCLINPQAEQCGQGNTEFVRQVGNEHIFAAEHDDPLETMRRDNLRQQVEEIKQALENQNQVAITSATDGSGGGSGSLDGPIPNGVTGGPTPFMGATHVPNPPDNLPGGPFEKAPGQRPGDFYGPKQPSGPRSMLRYVPPHGQGGPPGSKGYWKIQTPQGWQRYDTRGNPISVDQAHRIPRGPSGNGTPPAGAIWATRLGLVATFILWEFPLE